MRKKEKGIPGYSTYSFFIIAYCVLVDFTGNFNLSGQTGSSLMLIMISFIYLFLSFNIIFFQSQILKEKNTAIRIVRPFFPLLLLAAFSLFTHSYNKFRYQLFLSLLLFTLTLFLSLIYQEFHRKATRSLFLHMQALAALIYLISTFFNGFGTNAVYSPRSISMLCCVGILHLNLSKENGNHFYRAIFTFCILFSLSRTAILFSALLNTMYYLRVRSYYRKFTLNRIMLVLVALPIMFYGISAIPAIRERFSAIGDNESIFGFQLNTNGRGQVWSFLVSEIRQHPLFGSGIGSAQIAVSERFVSIVQPHNDYLRVTFDLGLVGLILWLFGFLGCIRQLKKLNFLDFTGCVAVILLYMGFALTDNPIVYPFFIASLAYTISSNKVGTQPEFGRK